MIEGVIDIKPTIRVLHVQSESESIYTCYRAELSGQFVDDGTAVALYTGDNAVEIIDTGQVLILGDDGKCVHRWTFDE